ncbi:MAG: molybdopterin-dependent oxidoreductase [Firmicutes bacterium]|nr:molybdopterin-dependent oxidoreductase [Bacillota bacterium]
MGNAGVGERRISRRRFLAGSGAAVAGLALAGSLARRARPGGRAWAASAPPSAPEKLVPSICQMCSTHCGILVHVRDGKITRITGNPEDPVSRGRLCARGQAGLQVVYDPDRLRQPLRRDASGAFRPVSWEQAFREIGAKLAELRSKEGPQALVWLTHPEVLASWEQRFLNAYGSPNWTPHAPTCYSSRNVGWLATLGAVPSGDYANTRYYVSFGRGINDGISNPQVQGLMTARRHGAHLVAFDPRLSGFASLADEWVPVRPGTDLAVVLAMIHVLIAERLVRPEAVAQTVGFEELARAVAPYTPDWAAEKSGVDAATITRIARGLAAAAPAAFVDPGWHGPQGGMYWNGVALTRATACLNALLGNLGQKGGLKLPGASPLPDEKSLALLQPIPEAPKLPRFDGAGGPEWPLAKGMGRAQALPEVIESGKPYPVRAVVVYHTNPVRAYPDGDRLVRALRKLDLVVVIDHQMSDTAWTAADYVLPESTYLERLGPVQVSGGNLVLPQPAIPPIYDTLGEDEILRRLAQATGLGAAFGYTLEEYNAALLAPLGLRPADLAEREVPLPVRAPAAAQPAALKTPSGKIELASSAMVQAGGPAVPVWEPPLVEPDGGNFRLITGHVPMHTHTSTENLAYLHALMPENQLWIHPSRARALGIAEGDLVEVRSEVASQRLKAHLTEGIVPEAVWMAHGFGCISPAQRLAYGKGASDAVLTPVRSAPYSGACAAAETLVTVRKVV